MDALSRTQQEPRQTKNRGLLTSDRKESGGESHSMSTLWRSPSKLSPDVESGAPDSSPPTPALSGDRGLAGSSRLTAAHVQPRSQSDEAYRKLWTYYNNFVSDSSDDDLIQSWTQETKGNVVFTGLFSAVISVLAVETLKELPHDAEGHSNAIVWVNGLWFTALSLSLCSGLLSTRIQRWARQYSNRLHPNNHAIVISADRIIFQRFALSAAIKSLSAILDISVFLFCSGLLVALFSAHKAVAGIVTGSVVAGCLLYILLTVLPNAFSGKDRLYKARIHNVFSAMRGLLRSRSHRDEFDVEELYDVLETLVTHIDGEKEVMELFKVIGPIIVSQSPDGLQPSNVEFLLMCPSFLDKLDGLVESCVTPKIRYGDESFCNDRLIAALKLWQSIIDSVSPKAERMCCHDLPMTFSVVQSRYAIKGQGIPLPPITDSAIFAHKTQRYPFSSTGLIANCYAHAVRGKNHSLVESWTSNWSDCTVISDQPSVFLTAAEIRGAPASNTPASEQAGADISDPPEAMTPEAILECYKDCRPGGRACTLCCLLYFLEDVLQTRDQPSPHGVHDFKVLVERHQDWGPALNSLKDLNVDLSNRQDHPLDEHPPIPSQSEPGTGIAFRAQWHTAYSRVHDFIRGLGLQEYCKAKEPISSEVELRFGGESYSFLNKPEFRDLSHSVRDLINWYNNNYPTEVQRAGLLQPAHWQAGTGRTAAQQKSDDKAAKERARDDRLRKLVPVTDEDTISKKLLSRELMDQIDRLLYIEEDPVIRKLKRGDYKRKPEQIAVLLEAVRRRRGPTVTS